MIVVYWNGWWHWMFGFKWFPQDGHAWVNRWLLALGPFDIRWRLRKDRVRRAC